MLDIRYEMFEEKLSFIKSQNEEPLLCNNNPSIIVAYLYLEYLKYATTLDIKKFIELELKNKIEPKLLPFNEKYEIDILKILEGVDYYFDFQKNKLKDLIYESVTNEKEIYQLNFIKKELNDFEWKIVLDCHNNIFKNIKGSTIENKKISNSKDKMDFILNNIKHFYWFKSTSAENSNILF